MSYVTNDTRGMVMKSVLNGTSVLSVIDVMSVVRVRNVMVHIRITKVSRVMSV